MIKNTNKKLIFESKLSQFLDSIQDLCGQVQDIGELKDIFKTNENIQSLFKYCGSAVLKTIKFNKQQFKKVFSAKAKETDGSDDQEEEKDKDKAKTPNPVSQSIFIYDKIYFDILTEAKLERQHLISEDEQNVESSGGGTVVIMTVKDGGSDVRFRTSDGKDLTEDEFKHLQSGLVGKYDQLKPGETTKVASKIGHESSENLLSLVFTDIEKHLDVLNQIEQNANSLQSKSFQINNQIAKTMFEAAIKNLKQNRVKKILKLIELESKDDAEAAAEGIAFILGACILGKAHKMATGMAKKKAGDESAKADKEKKDAAAKADKDKKANWVKECNDFLTNLPSNLIAAKCQSKWGDVTVDSMAMYNCLGSWAAKWDKCQIDSKQEKSQLSNFLRTGVGTQKPAHLQCVRQCLRRIMKQSSDKNNGQKGLDAYVKPFIDKASEIINKYPQFKLQKLSGDLVFTKDW